MKQCFYAITCVYLTLLTFTHFPSIPNDHINFYNTGIKQSYLGFLYITAITKKGYHQVSFYDATYESCQDSGYKKIPDKDFLNKTNKF